LEPHIATFFEAYNYTRGDPGPFPLVECRIGIAGEDLSSVAALVNGEALALKQAADALERQRLFARKANRRGEHAGRGGDAVRCVRGGERMTSREGRKG
jgi:hypothetical protein